MKFPFLPSSTLSFIWSFNRKRFFVSLTKNYPFPCPAMQTPLFAQVGKNLYWRILFERRGWVGRCFLTSVSSVFFSNRLEWNPLKCKIINWSANKTYSSKRTNIILLNASYVFPLNRKVSTLNHISKTFFSGKLNWLPNLPSNQSVDIIAFHHWSPIKVITHRFKSSPHMISSTRRFKSSLQTIKRQKLIRQWSHNQQLTNN